MKQAIQKHVRDFLAVIALFAVSLGVAGYILSHQRFYLPKWVPVIGSDFVDYKAEFSSGKSLTPGQGQTVDIAGVPVGEIGDVELKDGRAVVTMKIRRKFTPLYKDATALLRPKTGLEDMIVEVTPGSKASGVAPAGYTIPVSNTEPDVKLDEILAQLDTDTRDYLKLLVNGAGEGLAGNGKTLSAVFRRIDPLSRDVAKINTLLAKRHGNIRRSIHNFGVVVNALGDRDRKLVELIDSSNVVFRTLAEQDSNLRQALQLLPPTLRTAQVSLGKADRLARVLGPTLEDLRPAARALGPALVETRPFLRTTTPVIRDQLRPFARDAQPTVRKLRPVAQNLKAITPNLVTSFKVVNYLLNELAYNPAGSEEGYLFWAAWANHAGNSVFQTQDAHGTVRHGTFQASCSTYSALDTITQASPVLGTLTLLLNAPSTADICPKTSQAPGIGGG